MDTYRMNTIISLTRRLTGTGIIKCPIEIRYPGIMDLG